MRPRDSAGRAGGFIELDPLLPTIIVPDLHGRTGFFASLMECRLGEGGLTVAGALGTGMAQMLCLGDGFHSEARGAERWKKAFAEWLGGFEVRTAMDAEMAENLALMEMVMRAKLAWPTRFHFLKGNHENILNEDGDGNFPFGKFVQEGAMVLDFMEAFYGRPFLGLWSRFEKALPLFARGARFLASHAEPARAYAREELIDARSRPDVVRGLTWTDNDAAAEGSVARMLGALLPGRPGGRYFGGHRVIPGVYRLRAGGLFVQVHNPARYGIAWVMPDRDFDPERDMGEIRDMAPEWGAGGEHG